MRSWRIPAGRSGAPHLASGALRSNVLDLVRYLSWHLSGGTADGRRLLAPERIRRMRTPVIEYLPGFHYAYGLQVRSLAQGATAVGHGGNQKGISAFAGYVPEHNVCGVVLANLQRVPCRGPLGGGDPGHAGPFPGRGRGGRRALGRTAGGRGDWRRYTGCSRPMRAWNCGSGRLPAARGSWPRP